MDFSDFTYESGAEEAIRFIQRCLPSLSLSLDADSIMPFLQSGVVLCKFAATQHAAPTKTTTKSNGTKPMPCVLLLLVLLVASFLCSKPTTVC